MERIESVLQIFAVRAAAEIEQLRATEALRRSEASYRAIFEAAEDAIFIHDWDSGAIVDANPKACANYGYSRDELLRLSVGRSQLRRAALHARAGAAAPAAGQAGPLPALRMAPPQQATAACTGTRCG